MVEVRIGAAPGNGTRVIDRPSPRRNSLSLVSRFCPRLIAAKLYLAGSLRARPTNSCIVLAGTDGWTRTTDGDDEVMPIGTKLLIGSYWIFVDSVDVTARSLVTNISVWPSPAAAATMAAPRAPLAPLTFS